MGSRAKFRTFDDLQVGELYWLNIPKSIRSSVNLTFRIHDMRLESEVHRSIKVKHGDVLMFLGKEHYEIYHVSIDLPTFLFLGMPGTMMSDTPVAGLSGFLRWMRRVGEAPPGGW